jgi:hypothetical protein
LKNRRTYETTEATEKHSVSSKRQKKQRHREMENRLVGGDEVIFEERGLERPPGFHGAQVLIYSQ